MITSKAWVCWVDEDSAVVWDGTFWRILLENFVEEPKKDQAVWLEYDKGWSPTHVKVYPRGNYWLNRLEIG